MILGFFFTRLAQMQRRVFRVALLCAGFAMVLATTGSLMAPPNAQRKMSLSSSAFKDGQPIPVDYTCDGKNISPPLSWSGTPSETKSLLLIVDDPDAPSGVWTHWILWDISTDSSELAEDFSKSPASAKQGTNDFKKTGYGGPCPPAGKAHRYFFRIYALDTALNVPAGATRKEVDAAVAKHVLAMGQLMGTYRRK